MFTKKSKFGTLSFLLILALFFSVVGVAPAYAAIDSTSFAAKVDFITTGTGSAFVAIGDLDGDGKPDLAVANPYTSPATISIFHNTSTSGMIDATSFAIQVDFIAGSSPNGIAIGDLDGDGKPDLAVANFTGNTVSVFHNTSTSGTIDFTSFAAKVDFTTGTYPYSVAIGDLDGDGRPDLAVPNYGSNTVSIFHNTSTSGTLDVTSFAAKVDSTTGTHPSSATIGDLNGDGKPDLVVSDNGSNTLSVFRNISTSGTISLATKVVFFTGYSPNFVAIGDLDGDGKPDLAVANQDGTISIFRSASTSGMINFAPKVDFATDAPAAYSVAIGDLDEDGKPDLAVANYGDTVSVFRNTSTSGIINAASFAAKVGFTAGTFPISVAISDLNGDGKPDLAVANQDSNAISILQNTTVPDTQIDAHPATPTLSTSAAFTFSSTYITASFECSFDGGTYAPCISPQNYSSLAVGSHTFTVRAKDPAGNTDATPAVFTWTIQKERALNGGFETYAKKTPKIPSSWKASTNLGLMDGKNTAHKSGKYSVQITGNGAVKTLTQKITLSGSKGDPFTFSFWIKGGSIPKTGGLCQAQVLFYAGPTVKGNNTIKCPTGTYTAWKNFKPTFLAPVAYTNVAIKFTYSKASGTVWFDLVSLMK